MAVTEAHSALSGLKEVCQTSATLSSSLSTEVVETDATSFFFLAAEDDASAVSRKSLVALAV